VTIFCLHSFSDLDSLLFVRVTYVLPTNSVSHTLTRFCVSAGRRTAYFGVLLGIIIVIIIVIIFISVFRCVYQVLYV